MEQNIERQSETTALNDAATHAEPGYRDLERGSVVTPITTEKVYFPSEKTDMALSSLFEKRVTEIANENTRRDAEKFVSAFRAFVTAKGLAPCRVDAGLVSGFRDFLADRGHTASYIAKRMQNFRSLYRKLAKEGRAEEVPAGCFDIVTSSHPAGNQAARICSAAEPVVPALGRLAHMRINDPSLAASRDTLLAAVLSAGAANAAGENRGGSASDFKLLMRSIGLACESFGPTLPAELWIRAARECGISARDITAACASVPDGFGEGFLPDTASGIDRDTVLRKVAAAVLGTEPAWYALRIHRGSDSETVKRLIAATPELRSVRPFAPMEKLMVRRGRRLRSTVVERIRKVMFVEADPALMPETAKAIATAASVYRQSRAADAPFARIPRREMDNFRILLDNAAAEEIDLIDSAETAFSEGTPVEVTDGPFAGYRGRVSSRGNHLLLTVSLTSDFGLLVSAAIPAPYLRDINNR